MKVLITGAAGGLGATACELLLQGGHEVIASARTTAQGQAFVASGIQFFPADLATTSTSLLVEKLRGCDAVWHCAALSSPWGAPQAFEAANVSATRNLAVAAVAAQVPRFVHISTPSIYFEYRDREMVKEHQVAHQLVNDYAASKLRSETVLRDVLRGTMTAGVILRPRALFGPHDRVLLPRLLRVAKERGGALPLPKGGEVLADMTYLDNVVHAMTRATLTPYLAEDCPAYNITNGSPVYLKDFLAYLSNGLAARGLPSFTLKSAPYRPLLMAASAMEHLSRITKAEPALTRYGVGALAHHMTLDISAAKFDLGYSPIVELYDGLRRTIDAMARKNGL